MITQSINANLIPGQISPRVNVSQYDKKSRTLTFLLYKGSQPFNLSSGMSVTIEGTKPDKTGFQYPMTSTAGSNIVSMSIEQQMTVLAGDVPCEIVVAESGKRLASANFILAVEPAALRDDTVISETELPLIEEAAELAEHIGTYIVTIHEDALKAEGYAVGKQNGVDVGSGSVYFHNNAKYHNEQAAISATNASNSASTASTAAQTATTKASEASVSAQTAQEAAESLIGEVVDSEPYVLRQGLGNLADMNLVGGSIAWNQLVQNGNFADTSRWNVNVASTVVSASNNELTITASAQSSGIYQRISQAISGHKYLQSIDVKNTKALKVGYGYNAISITDSHTSFTNVSSVFNSQNTNSVFIVYSEAGSSENTIVVKNANLIDLTQMFGSEIADYIYALEQATAGAGVAWFRQYFRKDYYANNAGTLMSVNPSYRRVISKNLFVVDATTRTNNGVTYTIYEQNIIANGTASASKVAWIHLCSNTTFNKLGLIRGKRYTLSGNPDPSKGLLYIEDTNNNHKYEDTTGSGVTFTYNGETNLRICYSVFTSKTVSNLKIKPMLRLSDTDSSYEPYKEYTFPFDSSKELRGVPKLVDNKLSYDGDIYTADGTVTRKYGIVNLSTLTWTTMSNDRWISSSALTNIKVPANNDGIINGICSSMPVKSVNGIYPADSGIGISVEAVTSGQLGYLKARNGSTTNPPTGYLVYELATSTTESANPYQNPQRAFIDGTEEFIDYGVQSATRDVSIPVGNNTTYQLTETLPPTEDYVDGALKFKAAISALGTDESGRTTASRAYTTGEFFYKDGKMYKVLTSIAKGATFTINTNCQQTTLFAELKALAQ